MKTALTIGGSDSSGGAGIQADLKAFTVLGVYGMTAITAVTAQSTMGIAESFEMTPELVARQIDAVAGDIQVDACKTGMLANAAIIGAVEEALKRNQLQPYVCDPVMVSKSGARGGRLLKADALPALKKLFARATVITPNLRETAELTGQAEIAPTIAAAKDAARRLADMGAKAVIVKGIPSGNQMVDVYFDGREFLEFAGVMQPNEKTHGSGCAFSAAITAGLANRLKLVDAIDQAKQLVTMAIQFGDGQGRGITPVNVLAFAPKKK
ncbi:MAG TPA: bifunctional hydroxymethylpyrimidine kinase/phosphomethylpyrimidine kinase [Tepidisphaeraceae bacterium]|jgi:hydroxymethylpyrimidine/phosphomethylpyrimidine kinase